MRWEPKDDPEVTCASLQNSRQIGHAVRTGRYYSRCLLPFVDKQYDSRKSIVRSTKVLERQGVQVSKCGCCMLTSCRKPQASQGHCQHPSLSLCYPACYRRWGASGLQPHRDIITFIIPYHPHPLHRGPRPKGLQKLPFSAPVKSPTCGRRHAWRGCAERLPVSPSTNDRRYHFRITCAAVFDHAFYWSTGQPKSSAVFLSLGLTDYLQQKMQKLSTHHTLDTCHF